MDSFEWSKIAGAVFSALLLIFVPKTVIEMRQQPHGELKGGFVLPSAEAAAAPQAAEAGKAAEATPAAAGGFDAKAAVAGIASASADNGKATFNKCLACHSADKAAGHKMGPNLWNIVGRKMGSAEGFAGYSPGMKGKGEEWTFENLANFVHNPKSVVSDTKMIFPGIKDAAGVADLLAYVRTLADSPVEPPK